MSAFFSDILLNVFLAIAVDNLGDAEDVDKEDAEEVYNLLSIVH